MNPSRTTIFPMQQTILILLALVGTGIILLSTDRYGVGISADSVRYIGVARQLSNDKGAISYDGDILVLHPPLYPALLATIHHVFGIEPLRSVRVVNSFLFGFIVYFSGLLLFSYLTPSGTLAIAILGTVYVLLSSSLIKVSLMAWSEPLFICFVLFYLIHSKRYILKGNTKSLLLLSLTVALASLTRYIGIILIPMGVCSILFFRQDSAKVKVRHLFLFLFISAFPISLWLIRNYFLLGTLFGPRTASVFTFSQNARLIFDIILSWYVPGRVDENRLLVIFLIATIGLFGYLGVKINHSRIKSLLLESVPLLIFVSGYLSFLLVSSTITAYDQIDSRLLSPVIVPMTLLLLLLASKILTSLAKYQFSQKRAAILLGVVISIWVVNQVGETVTLTTNAINEGSGYHSKAWRESETVDYLLKNQTLGSQCVIYTNAADAVYILANLTTKRVPRKTMYNSPEIANDISDLKGYWPEEDNVCLVWFDKMPLRNRFTLSELQIVTNMDQIIRLEDGTIYSITKQ